MASDSTVLLSNDEGNSDNELEEDNVRTSRHRFDDGDCSGADEREIDDVVMQPTKRSLKNFDIEDAEETAFQDYFFLSLFTTICCCLPLGVIALGFSLKAGRLYQSDDEYGGRHVAIVSLAINTIAVVCGILIIGVVLIYFVLK